LGGEDLDIFNIVNRGDDAEMYFYGDIVGERWQAWGSEDMYPAVVRDVVAACRGKNLKVHINSGGGDMFAGITIHNIIKQSKAKSVTTYVDGLAASAASIIALAGDKVVMPPGAMLMIHQASTSLYGNMDEFLEEAEVLKKCNDSLMSIYEKCCKADKLETVKSMFLAETWLTAEESAELFENVVVDETKKVAACAKSDFYASYKKTPLSVEVDAVDVLEESGNVDNIDNIVYSPNLVTALTELSEAINDALDRIDTPLQTANKSENIVKKNALKKAVNDNFLFLSKEGF
jgi:ATP-dependent protease ClpP protease subunit